MTRERSNEQIPIRSRKSSKERQAEKAPFRLQPWLFDLFRILGTEQKTIANHLSVSKTMVSFWANDREPISQRYLETLHGLVFATIAENERQERLFHIELEANRKKLSGSEMRKIFALDEEIRTDILQNLMFNDNDELRRKWIFYFELGKKFHDMRVELSNATSVLCEKVAKEYRELSNSIERNPERPLHKMLRTSREMRNSLKNGCCSVFTDLEQLDNLLWFEEAFLQARLGAFEEQTHEGIKVPVTH